MSEEIIITGLTVLPKNLVVKIPWSAFFAMTCSMIFFCPFFVRTSLLQRKGLRDVILKISNKNNKLLHNYKQLTHLQFGKENTVEVIIPKFRYFFDGFIWCWHLWIGKALLLPRKGREYVAMDSLTLCWFAV